MSVRIILYVWSHLQRAECIQLCISIFVINHKTVNKKINHYIYQKNSFCVTYHDIISYPFINYREKEVVGYKYFMETPTSTTQRIEEDRVTYLNKGKLRSDGAVLWLINSRVKPKTCVRFSLWSLPSNKKASSLRHPWSNVYGWNNADKGVNRNDLLILFFFQTDVTSILC